MKSENISLIVAAISLTSAVLVVFISSGASFLQKKLDLKQRRADYNQEIRKIFINKRIDAGEMLITRYANLIHKLEWLAFLLANIDLDDNNKNNTQNFRDLFAKAKKGMDAMDESFERPDYKTSLYFDEQSINSNHHSEHVNFLQVERALTNLAESEVMFGTPKFKRNIEKYAEALMVYRNALLSTCALIRQDIARYGELD